MARSHPGHDARPLPAGLRRTRPCVVVASSDPDVRTLVARALRADAGAELHVVRDAGSLLDLVHGLCRQHEARRVVVFVDDVSMHFRRAAARAWSAFPEVRIESGSTVALAAARARTEATPRAKAARTGAVVSAVAELRVALREIAAQG